MPELLPLLMVKIWMPKWMLVLFVIASFAFAMKEGHFKALRNRAELGKFPFYFAAGAAFCFVILLQFDLAVRHAVQHANPSWAEPLRLFGDHLSHNISFWSFLTLAFLASSIFKWKKASSILFSMMLSAGLASILSQVFKFIVCRARPYSQMGPFSFLNWSEIRAHAYQSLPSGDVVIVAGAAGYLFFAVKNVFIKILIAILPLTVAFYRIFEDKHWPTDTLVSITFGFLIGYWIYRKQEASVSN